MSINKIVILDGAVVNPGDLSWDGLAELGEITIYDKTSPEKVIERISDANIVLTNKTLINAETINNTNIKYIGLFSTGYNVIDLDVARQKNICICNVPSYSSNAVAQLTFALLLNLCHKVQLHSDAVHNEAWIKSEHFCFWNYPQIELKDKIMGIIGYGAIGSKVARIALALDMKVIVHTRTPKKEIEDINFKFVGFDELLENADVVSIHCPLSDQTQNLIDKNALSKMKKNAFVLNTSRGPIVNEHDMAQALSDEVIAAYATDVISVEPMEAHNPLLNAKNCIITPHIAWVAKETRLRLLTTVEENIKAYLNGTPQNRVGL